MRRRIGWIALAAIAMLAGCGSQRDKHMNYSPTALSAPDQKPVAETLTNYRLGAGDQVTVTVFGVETLSGDREVNAAGNLDMPLVGAVPAAGKTTQELAQTLTTQLGARYLQNPQVTVALKAAVPHTVTVDGSVQSPGQYPIGDKTTLLKTIAMAHGTAQGANLRKVVVFRQIKGQRNAAAFDLKDIRDGKNPDPAIYADDIVVVDGKETSPAWSTLLQTVPLIGLFARIY